MRANQVRWMVAGLAAVGTLAAGGTAWLLSGGEPATQAAARTVERVSSEGVTAKGTVEPVSTQSLSFALSGTVTSVSVKPGDIVVVGQTLASIDQADAKQAVADAQAALDDAEAALATAIASASAAASPSPSAACTTSSPAAPSPATSASSSPSPSSHSALAGVSASGGRSCGSSGSGGSGGSGSTGSASQHGGGGGTDSILSAQQDVNNDRAALAKARRQLTGTVITSPVSGKVLDVAIKVGDTARSNVITVGVVSTMVVKASFSEADAVSLTVGESATVTLPGRGDQTYTAKITQIAQTATVSDNLVTYPVILTFDKVPDGVLVGQSANVTVAA